MNEAKRNAEWSNVIGLNYLWCMYPVVEWNVDYLLTASRFEMVFLGYIAVIITMTWTYTIVIELPFICVITHPLSPFLCGTQTCTNFETVNGGRSPLYCTAVFCWTRKWMLMQLAPLPSSELHHKSTGTKRRGSGGVFEAMKRYVREERKRPPDLIRRKVLVRSGFRTQTARILMGSCTLLLNEKEFKNCKSQQVNLFRI